jgi:hypothetical protein
MPAVDITSLSSGMCSTDVSEEPSDTFRKVLFYQTTRRHILEDSNDPFSIYLPIITEL